MHNYRLFKTVILIGSIGIISNGYAVDQYEQSTEVHEQTAPDQTMTNKTTTSVSSDVSGTTVTETKKDTVVDQGPDGGAASTTVTKKEGPDGASTSVTQTQVAPDGSTSSTTTKSSVDSSMSPADPTMNR